MSDALAYALRRYERIRPEPREKSDLLKAHALADWIERDVCPLVADLSRRPTFQTLARWPLDHLLSGAASAARRLIEAVDARLGTIAQALAAFAKKKAIARVLDRKLSAAAASVGARKRSVNQKNSDVEVEFNAMAFNERRSLSGAPLMEFISQKPWRDLTSSLDFFRPAADLNLKDREAYLGPDTSRVQMGMFLPFCNPRLRLLGDFVSRALLIRVEHWQGAVGLFSSPCRRSIQAEVRGRDRHWSAAETEYAQLDAEARQLRHLLLAGSEAKMREAAVALVQVQAAFQPQSDFSWLGPALPSVAYAALYRDAIENRQNFALAEQIAASLAECASIYHSTQDAEEILRQARDNYCLVLVEGPGRREAYWRGVETGERWSRQNACWQFLVTLAEAAKLRTGVDAFDLNSTAKDSRSRIKRSIPPELDSLIQPRGRGTYVLELVPEQICVLRVEANDRLAPQP